MREIEEELGVGVTDPRHVISLDHRYPEKQIRLHFLRCVWPRAAVPVPCDGQEAGWFTRGELRKLDLAPADREFVNWLEHDGSAARLAGSRRGRRRTGNASGAVCTAGTRDS